MNPYKTADSFRRALEDRISEQAKTTGVDIQRLRRDVAFDRLLVRLFAMPSPPWALKGGYAMQLRTESARTTKDVDLAMRDANIFSKDEATRNATLQSLLIEYASKDINDYFTFLVSEPAQDLANAPEGGVRFHIEARLADRTFEKFLLDIASGDFWSDPLDLLKSSDILEFAGFVPRELPAIPQEQQFAEKLHAYSLPRPPDRPNSRVKDLIDMNLLIQRRLDRNRTNSFLHETYERRNTHKLDLNILPPPERWAISYPKMAEECGLDPDIRTAFHALVDFLKTL